MSALFRHHAKVEHIIHASHDLRLHAIDVREPQLHSLVVFGIELLDSILSHAVDCLESLCSGRGRNKNKL